MQIIVDTNESDENLKLAVEHALKELEKRTGQEFQVVIKPKSDQPSQPEQPQAQQPQSQPQQAPTQQSASNPASHRANEMENMMNSVDLSVLGNPKGN